MLSCCNMFPPKQRQRWLLHCWSKQHKVCHCYNELCWLGIKLSCQWERIFCSDDPNCAKWKCLAAQMTNMSHSGMLQMEAACWKSLSGLCPTSFIHVIIKDPRGEKPCCQYGIKPCLCNCFSCLTSFCLSWLCFLRKKTVDGNGHLSTAPAMVVLTVPLINYLGQHLQHYWWELRLRPRGRATSSSCHVDLRQTGKATASNCHDLSLTEDNWLVCKLQNKYL